MSLLQATPLTARVTDVVRSTTTRVVLGCTAAAWVGLSLLSWRGSRGAVETHHHGHGPGPVPGVEVVDPVSLAWSTSWLLMVIAMMWPLAIPTISAVSRSSFRGWRARLGVTCLATVTVLWVVVGVAGAALARTLGVGAGSPWWQLSFVCLALMAFASARRSRLLETCLRMPPLAPGGRRGVITAMRAGVLTWRRCAILCGPLMLAMVVGHSVVLMMCASLAVWWESWHPRAWRDRVPVALVATGGLWVVFSAVFGAGVGHG